MGQLHFTLQNPKAKPKANQPVIYTDRPSENTLHLILSQDESLGIPTLDVEDRVVVSFSKKLLAEAKAEQVAGGADWEVESVEEHTDYFRFHLQPAQTLDFEGQQLIVVFQQLPGRSKTNAEVSVVVSKRGIDINGGNEKLAVMAYPSDHKNLQDVLTASIAFNEQQDDLGHTNIFTSSPTLQPPVANQVRINLSFRGSQLVEAIPSEKHPFFIFSFSYGTRNSDLTDDLKTGEAGFNAFTSAHNFFADLKGQNRWHLQQNTGTTTWRIEPTQINTHLFTRENDSVNLWLDHIISNYPDGEATLYIQWGDIPGYDDDWMTLKVPKRRSKRSGVFRFSTPRGKINYGDPVFLDWDVFDAPQVELTCNENEAYNQVLPVRTKENNALSFIYCGGIVPDKTDLPNGCGGRTVIPIVPNIPKLSFFLRAQDTSGQPIGDKLGPVEVNVTHFPAPTVEEFEAKIKDDQLHFSWQIKGHGSLKYTITDGGGLVVSEGLTTNALRSAQVTLTEQHSFHPPYVFSAQAGKDGTTSEVVLNVEWEKETQIELSKDKVSYNAVFTADNKFLLVVSSYKSIDNTTRGVSVFQVYNLKNLTAPPITIYEGELGEEYEILKLHYCDYIDRLYCLTGSLFLKQGGDLFFIDQPFQNLRTPKKPERITLRGKVTGFDVTPDGQRVVIAKEENVEYFLSAEVPHPKPALIPFKGKGKPVNIFIAPSENVAFVTTANNTANDGYAANTHIYAFSLDRPSDGITNAIEVEANFDGEFPRSMGFSKKDKRAFVTNSFPRTISYFSYIDIPKKADTIKQEFIFSHNIMTDLKISKNAGFAILTAYSDKPMFFYISEEIFRETPLHHGYEDIVFYVTIAPFGTYLFCSANPQQSYLLKPVFRPIYRIYKPYKR